MAEDRDEIGEMANDGDPDVRRALAQAGHALDKLVDDEDPKVRETVARLADRADREHLLDKLVDDESWEVRQAVAHSAAVAGRTDLLDKLRDDPDLTVRIEVRSESDRLAYYREQKAHSFGMRLMNYGSKPDPSEDSNGSLLKEFDDILAPAAEDPDTDVRRMAVWAAEKGMRNPKIGTVRVSCHELLTKMADDENYLVRKEVARAGGRTFQTDLMGKLIGDPEPDVRAVMAGYGYGLDKLADDEDFEVRIAAAKGAADWERDDVLAVLAHDPEPDVRKAVAESGYEPDEEHRKPYEKDKQKEKEENIMATRKNTNTGKDAAVEKTADTGVPEAIDTPTEDEAPDRKPGLRSLNIPLSRLWGERIDGKREADVMPRPISGSKKMEDGSTRSWAFYKVPVPESAAKALGLEGKNWRFTVNDRDVRQLFGTDSASATMREDRELKLTTGAWNEGANRWEQTGEKKVTWGELAQKMELASKRENAPVKVVVNARYISGPFGDKDREVCSWRLPRFAQVDGKDLEGWTAYIPAASVKHLGEAGADPEKLTGTSADDQLPAVEKVEITLPASKSLAFAKRSELVEGEDGSKTWEKIPAEKREPTEFMQVKKAIAVHKAAISDNAAYYASGKAARDERFAEQMRADVKEPASKAAAKTADKPKAKTR